MPTRTKVLFLCIGNACRSQMAEAIAKHLAEDVIEASSGGLVPFGEIPATTRAVFAERGFSTAGQRSKALRPQDLYTSYLVINMTGRRGDSLFSGPAPPLEGWMVGGSDGDGLPG